MKKLFSRIGNPYLKKAKESLIVFENGQIFIDANMVSVIDIANEQGFQYEILKGELPIKEISKKDKK